MLFRFGEINTLYEYIISVIQKLLSNLDLAMNIISAKPPKSSYSNEYLDLSLYCTYYCSTSSIRQDRLK